MNSLNVINTKSKAFNKCFQQHNKSEILKKIFLNKTAVILLLRTLTYKKENY